MNWTIKVSIGMLLFATLLIALGVAFMRANEYKPLAKKVGSTVLAPAAFASPAATQAPGAAEKAPLIKK